MHTDRQTGKHLLPLTNVAMIFWECAKLVWVHLRDGGARVEVYCWTGSDFGESLVEVRSFEGQLLPLRLWEEEGVGFRADKLAFRV